jgi:hypothetical protein
MTEPKAISGRARGNIPFAPADYDLNVKVGEMVVAGLTVIARKRDSAEDDVHAET